MLAALGKGGETWGGDVLEERNLASLEQGVGNRVVGLGISGGVL